jgi:hypothetical protein
MNKLPLVTKAGRAAWLETGRECEIREKAIN